jgi:hypothetical protein
MIAARLFLVSSVLSGGGGGTPHKRERQLRGEVIRANDPTRAVQSHRTEPARPRMASESYSRC